MAYRIAEERRKGSVKALLQRVSEAMVVTGEGVIGKIGKGICVFLCVEKGDSEVDLEYIMRKVSSLRIFEDAGGKMNLSVKDIHGEILVVSQFTLAAEVKKGNRPSFDLAEEPGRAREMYLRAVDKLKQEGIYVATGMFAASMKVHIINDGPVTLLLDSRR